MPFQDCYGLFANFIHPVWLFLISPYSYSTHLYTPHPLLHSLTLQKIFPIYEQITKQTVSLKKPVEGSDKQVFASVAEPDLPGTLVMNRGE